MKSLWLYKSEFSKLFLKFFLYFSSRGISFANSVAALIYSSSEYVINSSQPKALFILMPPFDEKVSQTFVIENGELQTGKFGSIWFVDFDYLRARNRKCVLCINGE